MQRTRESAIASAVEKAKSEISTNSVVAPNAEEIIKKHAQEIECLRVEHEAALKAAVNAAKVEVAKSLPDDTTKAAIAAHDKEVQAKHAEEISAAVERGRMEQAAKGKLKDAQLVRAQNKFKELEAQVLEWRKAGLIPDAAPATVPTATAPAAASAAPPVTPTAPVASTSKTVPPKAPAASAPATAPVAPPSAGTGPARRALGGSVSLGPPEAGRGRGAPRGRGRGISIRGAHAGAPPTVGVQIMGAANKRGREDEIQSDDSLAKRLKPAGEATIAGGTGAAGAGVTPTAPGGSKPPVTIRRPPPPPPS